MDLGLKGKVALVTGAGSQIGFGKGIALTLAREGCDIIVNDVNLEGAEQTAAEVKALGRKAVAVKADVSNSAEVNASTRCSISDRRSASQSSRPRHSSAAITASCPGCGAQTAAESCTLRTSASTGADAATNPTR